MLNKLTTSGGLLKVDGEIAGLDTLGEFKKAANSIPKPDALNVEEVQVDPETDTTQGVLASLLKTDSPLILEAKQRAQQQAASRGLQNSTLAAGAGQRAAIQEAFPIAAQTAEQNLQVKLVNSDAKNRAAIIKYQEANANWRETQNLALGYYQIQSADIRAFLDRQSQEEIALLDRESREEIAAKDRSVRYKIAQMQVGATYAQIASQHSLQSQGHQNNIEAWALQEIAQVNSNPNLTPAQQANSVRQINSIAGTNYAWSNTWQNSSTTPRQITNEEEETPEHDRGR